MVLRTLVVGVGGMGASHARAYARLGGFNIVGFVVNQNVERAQKLAAELGITVPVFTDYYEAMKKTKPDVVSINTYVDTHAEYAIHAMQQGCHVFLEKPIAQNVEEAERVAQVARETNRKLVVGYILRHHPAWQKFIDYAREMGKPVVMRMNLNQQSYGHEWKVHKEFIRRMPPLVDCGVHYVDVMCQITRANPKRVHGIAARLTEEIPTNTHNYGALHIVFDDGSVGWYEVGWGPMISKTAFFVKDVIGPRGSVSIGKDVSHVDPSDVSQHTAVNTLVVHWGDTDDQGNRIGEDQYVEIKDEPTHEGLCQREQEYLYLAIAEDIDLSDQIADAVASLKICYAAVESYMTGKAISL
ncbi:MAG: Gfo/Idh/MocA family protein [Candidatus Caldatribacteriaceae bacterium]